jgi:hypothetical protein
MAKSLLSNEEEMSGLTEGYGGQFQSLTPDEEASPEEEEAMSVGMHHMMDNLYSDEGLPKFANVMHQDQRELFLVISDILVPMLQAARQEIEEITDEPAPASVFFSEGGLLQSGVMMLFDLAQQLQLPGAQEPDQFAAALQKTYINVGKHLQETGDEEAMQEAIALGGDLVAEGEVGEPDLDKAQKLLSGRLKKAGVAEATDRAFQDALYGGAQ